MARKGAMTKNPPLRGVARKEFRAAQREAVASGGPMPTQDKFREQSRLRPQPVARPTSEQMGQSVAGTATPPGEMSAVAFLPDKMYRVPQPAGQPGDTLGAAMANRMTDSSAVQSPVFNAFPGNNLANLNDANIGRFSNLRIQGGSPNFNEGGDYKSMVMPGSAGGYDEFGQFVPPGQQEQMSPAMRQRMEQRRQQMFQQIPPGQIQNGMFRSPGVPMQNIPGMNQGFQNGLDQRNTQAVPANWKPSPESVAQKQAYQQAYMQQQQMRQPAIQMPPKG